MKRIVIALDFDPSANKVADIGHGIAKALSAETVLLHVVAGSTYYSSLKYSPIIGFDNFSSIDTIETESVPQLMQVAENFLQKSKKRLGDDSITTLVESGDFSETIVKVATEMKAEMIVMGTQNRHGIEKVFAGSVAEDVLHHSVIPLLIIPAKTV